MTRLVALEVVGFKSFADRTRFDFPEGLTAIVGPNGSGKSNVVDAVKWVLGEQSVRSLRGREMTDVIFSGSASRRPLNAAETTLIFENASRDLPLDADEVRITRRVYRSGEGEYLVNGEASRLRDIRELLSGTGAGAEAYSVIEQGRVDALLVASGRDRRAVFEEAAGITRFRVRRAEALRRLERTDHSLARLGDILGEVAGRLGTVRQQAARARRHRELTARLRTLRLAIASTDMVVIDQEIADGRRSISAVRENLGMFEAVLNDAAARARAIQSDDESLGLSIEAHRTTVAEWRQTAAAAEASLRGSIDQRTAIADDALQLSKRLGMALGRHRAGTVSTEATRREIAEAQMKLDSLNESISQLPSDDEDIDGMSEARQRVLAARERSRQCDAAHRERMTELSRIEDELDRAISAIEPTRQAAESAVAEQTEVEFRRSACQGLLKSLEERSLVAAEAVKEAERDAAAVADSIIARMDEQGSWRARLESCRGRRETLAELVERRDGVSQAVRDLLANPFEGIAGLVSEVVDAQPDIARIVDAALGGRSTPIAVESLESMPEGGVANAHRSGRICLVSNRPITAPLPRPPIDPDVVGRLDELVDAPAEMQPAITRLLGRYWIVETSIAARRIVSDAPAGTVVATRTGECLSTDGWLETGVTEGGGLVSRRSEMTSLDERIIQLERLVSNASLQIESLRARQAGLSESIKSLRLRHAAERDALVASRAERTRLDADAQRHRSRVVDAETAVSRLHATIADRHATRSVATAQLDQAVADAAAAAAAVTSAEQSLADAERSRGAAIARLGELRLAAAEWRQHLATACERLASLQRETAGAWQDVLDIRSSLDANLVRGRRIDLEALAAGQTLAHARWHEQQAAAIVTTLAAERAAIADAAKLTSTTSADARESISHLAQTLHRLELNLEHSMHSRARILDRIRDDYGVDLAGPLDDGFASKGTTTDPVIAEIATSLATDADARARADEEMESIKKKLISMPAINPEAVTEAEELERRHADLEGQRNDLVTAKKAVEELVARIDDESRKLLGETIETVRGHFREIFGRVFGGGQADIVLDPDVDLLETSVEIVARPPGKEPRSITLLSGGEKTMTALSLLLAIFRSRPSPFCVLDEVDAALDEANVDRFVNTLRDFLGTTQFIVVTHSKKTMAAATNLYGVTMEESGVSTRVAVRLERQAVSLRARAA